MTFLEKEKEPNKSDIIEKRKTITLVLSILCSASYRLRQLSINELCRADVLNTLIKTCRLTYKRKSVDAAWDSHGAPMVLSHIIEAKNFVPLLKSNFIFQVYDMANPVKEHQNCDLCSDVNIINLYFSLHKNVFIFFINKSIIYCFSFAVKVCG